MTGEMFLAYVEQCLIPTLRRNDIVVMDNCRVHLSPAIRVQSRKCGDRALPAEINPIEMPYSKFKTFLRTIAAGTVPRPYSSNSLVRPQVGPRECANYFKHAGYASI